MLFRSGLGTPLQSPLVTVTVSPSAGFDIMVTAESDDGDVGATTGPTKLDGTMIPPKEF